MGYDRGTITIVQPTVNLNAVTQEIIEIVCYVVALRLIEHFLLRLEASSIAETGIKVTVFTSKTTQRNECTRQNCKSSGCSGLQEELTKIGIIGAMEPEVATKADDR